MTTRGRKPSKIGSERVSQNGYTYVKTIDGWKLKHHIVAEKKYARTIDKDVTVKFVDGDRTNFDPDNIEIRPRYAGRVESRKKVLRQRIRELQAELELLEVQASES